MKRALLCTVLLGAAVLSFTACESLSNAGSDTYSPVVARVGAYKITIEDLQRRLRDTPAAYQQYTASPEGRRQFLNLLVREKVLLSEAKNAGIPRDPAYKQAVAKYRREWNSRLKDYEEALQVESALRHLRAKDLSVSDAEVERYYTEHRADFDHPVEILASHILLGSPLEAEAAQSRLRSGESFERVAKSMSKDPATAMRGGRMAPFHRGMLVPEFEDTAFALKVGEVSSIVKTQFGFHIIKKLGERALPSRSADEVKEEVRSKLEREKFNQWATAKQTMLGVHVDEQLLAQMSREGSEKQ